MHEVTFTSHRFENHTLFLESWYFRGRVSLAGKEGAKAWRIFVWHRLQDAEKASCVVEGARPLPFQVREHEGGLQLEAEGMAALWIRLNRFGFRFEGLEAFELESHRFGPLGKASGGAAREWTAFHEENDGLPLGAGLSLLINEPAKRRYYGLGERTGFLDKKGKVWTNWNTDDPHHHPDTDPLYQSHPFVLGLERGRAFGLYLDESWRTVFDLASVESQQSVVHTDGPTFDLYLIPGPSPKEVLTGYTALVGRAKLPPLWSLGHHQCRYSYANQDLALKVAEEYRKRDIPLDALWLDIDYMEGFKVFTFDRQRFPDVPALTSGLEALGVKTVAIVDPGVKKEPGYRIYEEGHSRGYFVRSHRDEELVGSVWPSPAVWPDFSRHEVREWWSELHQFYLDGGIAGIWNDMNEPAAFTVEGHSMDPHNRTLPGTAKQGDHFHAETHNLYGLQMCQSTYQGLRRLQPDKRPFILTRAGFSGIQKYAMVWTGDNHSYWEHLESSIPMLLNLGLSGVPFVGADIGGFGGNTSGELLARWTWLGAFYPFMRNHSGKTSRRQEPWMFGAPWEGYIREAVLFRYRMLPLLYTLAEQACQSGLPPMRPLIMEYPQDLEAETLCDQFLFGPDLLVAPSLKPGQNHRLVYLPEGEWQDFWSGESYQGPLYLPVPTPFDRVPLFQRAGSALPFTEAEAHTTDAYWEKLCWRVAPSEKIHGVLYEDSGDGYQPGAVSTLEGSYRDNRLKLSFHDRSSRPREFVEASVRGVAEPSWCSAPYQYSRDAEDGPVLKLDLTKGSVEVSWG